MTPPQVVLLVVGILAFQVAIWIPVALWMRRRSAQANEALRARIEAAGERADVGPVSARFTRKAGIAAMSTSGVAALTRQRVIFVGLVGAPVEIPRDDIVDVRADRWFLGTRRGGTTHVIVRRRDGSEVSVSVADPSAWIAALQGRGRVVDAPVDRDR